MSAKDDVPPEEVRRLLRYDPITGYLFWRERRESDFTGRGRISAAKYCEVFNRRFAGVSTGQIISTGYVLVRLKHKLYMAHRLAWVLMTGEWPDGPIDHADRCRSNNVWANLRLCSHSENIANGPKRRTNTSGYKGVTWDAHAKKWRAKVGVNGKAIYLGIFDDKEEAAAAYAKGAAKHFGSFARTE